jgi:two-component system, chemotaxis family, protein-glutamate methylesterase/glutaminase
MPRRPGHREQMPRTFVVASSAGGLNALTTVLSALPDDFASPVICVQHMHPSQPSLLAEILARRTPLAVAFATAGDVPQAGQVLIAPPDRHLVVERDGRLALWDGPPVNHVRPAADLLFSSAAAVYDGHAVAVVLSGTGHDGAAGSAAVQEQGGKVVVQSPESCEFAGMVEATMRLIEADAVVPLAELGAELRRLAAEASA